MNILFVYLSLLLMSHAAYADLNSAKVNRLSSDYDRISRLKAEANPDIKKIDELVELKNKIFMEKLKKKISQKELDLISRDILTVKTSNAKKIEKEYMDKMDSTKNIKLSDNNQKVFKDLLVSSSSYLIKKVDSLSPVKRNFLEPEMNIVEKSVIQNPKEEKIPSRYIASTYAKELNRNQKDALYYSKIEKKKFAPDQYDSLFNKISKAYNRNLEKVIEEDDGFSLSQ